MIKSGWRISGNDEAECQYVMLVVGCLWVTVSCFSCNLSIQWVSWTGWLIWSGVFSTESTRHSIAPTTEQVLPNISRPDEITTECGMHKLYTIEKTYIINRTNNRFHFYYTTVTAPPLSHGCNCTASITQLYLYHFYYIAVMYDLHHTAVTPPCFYYMEVTALCFCYTAVTASPLSHGCNYTAFLWHGCNLTASITWL